MEIFLDPNILATFALLVGLELVLGIDNILLLSIVTNRLPEKDRNKARIIGLALAFFMRLFMLFGAAALQRLTAPVLFFLSIKDIILIAGGAFLLIKAVKEIHHVVEDKHADLKLGKASTAFMSVITQIVLLDAVFSIDSVITAVGLTDHLLVIYSAVIVSFIAVLGFSKPISNFVLSNPSMKILALSFLVCIGATLALEGFHHEVPKAYLYLPMGFALIVELLELRYEGRKKKRMG